MPYEQVIAHFAPAAIQCAAVNNGAARPYDEDDMKYYLAKSHTDSKMVPKE